MTRETVRIFVLETDEPHPETQEHRGSYGDILTSLFTAAGNDHDPPYGVETDIHYVVDDPEGGHDGHVPKASEISQDVTAILITGSTYDAHGDDEWITKLLSLLRELWTTRPEIKFSGVCFGHQLLARLLGAKVERHPVEEWEISHTEMKLSEVGRKLFLTEDETLSLHQMHQDHVTTVPSAERSNGLLDEGTKVHVWASTDHTAVQGLYIRDRVFSSQGHLGFDEHTVHREIELRKDAGTLDEGDADEVDEGAAKAHLKHDGKVVAAAILRFFVGDDHDID